MPTTEKNTTGFLLTLISLILLFPAGDIARSGDQEPAWKPAFDRAMKLYQEGKTAESLEPFEEALGLVYGRTPLNKSPRQLEELFDTESMEGRVRFELGRYQNSQGDIESAARLYRDAMLIAESQAGRYLGVKDGCKSCHFKQWKSWKDTKMANAMDALKPGVSTEIKSKFGLDPKRDYSEDPNCLPCHTTGWNLLDGYRIPRGQKYKVRRASEQTRGVTCESCHGPGSKYGPLHKDVDDNARKYRPQEFFAVGEYETGEHICLRCHNSRSPTTPPDYEFDYDKRVKDGTHEKFELIYRIETESETK